MLKYLTITFILVFMSAYSFWNSYEPGYNDDATGDILVVEGTGKLESYYTKRRIENAANLRFLTQGLTVSYISFDKYKGPMKQGKYPFMVYEGRILYNAYNPANIAAWLQSEQGFGKDERGRDLPIWAASLLAAIFGTVALFFVGVFAYHMYLEYLPNNETQP